MNRAGERVLLEDCLKQLRLPAMLREYPACAGKREKRVRDTRAFCWTWPTGSWSSGWPTGSSGGSRKAGFRC